MAAAAASLVLPKYGCTPSGKDTVTGNAGATFRYCLNTSTINGQEHGLKKSIEVAARAGYDGVELWVRDVQAYLQEGHSLASLDSLIKDSGLRVENAIGFAPWLVDDEEVAAKGFVQMKEEMELMAEIGCRRIAAPAAGRFVNPVPDLFRAGERYGALMTLGRETGVMPQLEFWGASPILFHIGQVLMIAAVAGNADARILADVYHMFRGGSGFDTLKMLHGNMIEVFHINDYPGNIARTDQVDADRVYPGDGVAPLPEIFDMLSAMGGEKVLSLELFNRSYWENDPLTIATTGLQKMKQCVSRQAVSRQ